MPTGNRDSCMKAAALRRRRQRARLADERRDVGVGYDGPIACARPCKRLQHRLHRRAITHRQLQRAASIASRVVLLTTEEMPVCIAPGWISADRIPKRAIFIRIASLTSNRRLGCGERPTERRPQIVRNDTDVDYFFASRFNGGSAVVGGIVLSDPSRMIPATFTGAARSSSVPIRSRSRAVSTMVAASARSSPKTSRRPSPPDGATQRESRVAVMTPRSSANGSATSVLPTLAVQGG